MGQCRTRPRVGCRNEPSLRSCPAFHSNRIFESGMLRLLGAARKRRWPSRPLSCLQFFCAFLISDDAMSFCELHNCCFRLLLPCVLHCIVYDGHTCVFIVPFRYQSSKFSSWSE